MSVIETKYRDIPFEEVEEAHPVGRFSPASREEWEREDRGRPIKVKTPPIPEDHVHGSRDWCGARWYWVVGGAGKSVCEHIAEIGD